MTGNEIVEALMNSNELMHKQTKVLFSDEELYMAIKTLSFQEFIELQNSLDYDGYHIRFDSKHGCYIID